jgi:hypothetical protein
MACVAAILSLAAALMACSPDSNTAPDSGASVGNTASNGMPTLENETPSSTPTTPPAATTAPATPTTAPETTQPEPTAIPTEPGQVILNPEPEVDGDPGGESWSDVGVGSLTGDAKCNPEFKVIELELNGATTVRDSEIKVTQKPQGLVITTSSVLLATALIVNDDAAAKISSTWWNPSGNLSKRSILLPGVTWEPVIASGEFRTIKACTIKE